MKKITLLLLFVAGLTNAQIVNVPDANFKSSLIALGVDTNNDGEIQVAEAAAFTGMLNVVGENIANLQGIEAFVNMTGLNCNQNQLTSLDVSSNTALETLQCFQNQITTLNISNNLNLTVLQAWSNPLSDIDLSNCPSLQMLGLSGTNLLSLDCSNNFNLTSLAIAGNQFLETVFIKNGSDESEDIDAGSWQENWDFGNNPNLVYVCADEDQVAQIQGFAGANYHVNSYCSIPPGGNFNTITGTAQFDANNDGCDPGDFAIPYLSFDVDLDASSTGSLVYTDEMGVYDLYVGDIGTYSITANFENPDYFIATPSPADVPVTVIDNSTIIQDFCITANGVRPDAEIVIAPIFRSRPGFDATYRLVYKNKGNQVLSGTVDFAYDDTVLDFVSSTTAPDSQNTGLLSFDFIDLQPFENRFVEIVLNVNDPTETPPVNINDVLTFTSNISTGQADETPDDNTFVYDEIVIGSFDPNDIICLQGDVAPSTLIGDYLHYVINFENTGNAIAQNVVVTAEINPDDFDINTLQILNASDEMSVSINNNLIEFIFENISLSTGGHGNILLKMKTNGNLVISDIVSNEANIYFDFNFPVTTNMADTTFETLSVDEFGEEISVALYPNPSDTVVTIEATSRIQTVQMYDVQGRVILSKDANDQTTSIDVSSFANGMYFLVIKTDRGEVTKRVLKK
ncbi:T9SS type A sorting domain-containing protein [Dokdonia sp.]|uniref:DUF7619 domain-containing protein n=1 Tax=Dokdonia sp. TaxID=2024995 RepID=UPI0032656D69